MALSGKFFFTSWAFWEFVLYWLIRLAIGWTTLYLWDKLSRKDRVVLIVGHWGMAACVVAIISLVALFVTQVLELRSLWEICLQVLLASMIAMLVTLAIQGLVARIFR